MKTQIFDSYFEFPNRENKLINGVNNYFILENSYWEK